MVEVVHSTVMKCIISLVKCSCLLAWKRCWLLRVCSSRPFDGPQDSHTHTQTKAIVDGIFPNFSLDIFSRQSNNIDQCHNYFDFSFHHHHVSYLFVWFLWLKEFTFIRLVVNQRMENVFPYRRRQQQKIRCIHVVQSINLISFYIYMRM
jgi:hypothetical protein